MILWIGNKKGYQLTKSYIFSNGEGVIKDFTVSNWYSNPRHLAIQKVTQQPLSRARHCS